MIKKAWYKWGPVARAAIGAGRTHYALLIFTLRAAVAAVFNVDFLSLDAHRSMRSVSRADADGSVMTPCHPETGHAPHRSPGSASRKSSRFDWSAGCAFTNTARTSTPGGMVTNES